MIDLSKMTVAGLQAESDRCESAIGEAERIIADLKARLAEVRAEIARRMRPSPEPRISDHALLRYMERVMGVDVDAVRSEILNEKIKAALKMGATAVTVNGVKMIAKEGTIVTVLSEEMKPKRKPVRGRQDFYDTNEQLAGAGCA